MSKVNKTEEEFKAELDQNSYRILRQKGTELAFTGEYCDCKDKGCYLCKACGEALFDSVTKYDSGSGWPSFYQPITKEAVTEIFDESHGMRRVEVVCNSCDSHLGHMFEDGPAPTGLRFCINSASLILKKS